MLFYIRFQGKEHKIRVESRHGQTYVQFDGQAEETIDLHSQGNDYMLLDHGKVFHANVVGNKTDFTVFRPSGNLAFTVESEYKRIVGLLRGQDLQHESNVYAKMPGKIAKISVKKGDTVAQGDPVLVMEAMKMENEIRSPAAGVIAKLCVTEGQAVESGALLVEIATEETE